jgi:hypothetical protein
VRVTLADVANSRIPHSLGLCATDYPRIASYVNEAIQQLISVAGETGFWGGWAKVVFQIACGDPYITLPAEFARIVNIAVCRRGIPIFNEWYEVLEAGIGLQTPCQGKYGCGIQAAFERANVLTTVDLTASNQYIRVYITDARDIGKRIIFTGAKDSNGYGIYSTDPQNPINGFALVFDQPFTTSAFVVTAFSGVIKDVTYGDVLVKQVDATTGAEVLLARYTPTQTNPTYRRYYLQAGCPIAQNADVQTRQVVAMAKYEYQPVVNPTDFLIIGNIPALKAKCESIRFSEIDNANSQAMALLKHRQAVKLLNQELQHYGGDQPDVNVAVFGTAKLERQMIGSLY